MDTPDPPLPSPRNGDTQDPTARGLLETVPGGNETDGLTISTPRGASPRKSRSGQKTIVSYSDRFIPSRCVLMAAGVRPDLPLVFGTFSRWWRFLSVSLSVFLASSLSLSPVSHVCCGWNASTGLGRRGWTPRCWSWRRLRHTCLSRRRIRTATRRLCTA